MLRYTRWRLCLIQFCVFAVEWMLFNLLLTTTTSSLEQMSLPHFQWLQQNCQSRNSVNPAPSEAHVTKVCPMLLPTVIGQGITMWVEPGQSESYAGISHRDSGSKNSLLSGNMWLFVVIPSFQNSSRAAEDKTRTSKVTKPREYTWIQLYLKPIHQFPSVTWTNQFPFPLELVIIVLLSLAARRVLNDTLNFIFLNWKWKSLGYDIKGFPGGFSGEESTC